MVFMEVFLQVILYASTCSVHAIGTVTSILHHPKSRLVPVGVEVTFICKVRDDRLGAHWVIDGDELAFRDSIIKKAEEGYDIEPSIVNGSVTLLIMTVNATMDKNGTTIYCSSGSTHSDEAHLLTISETPLLQNPLVVNLNASSILVKWSPPFLWPGYSIDHYNISVNGPGRIRTYYRINARFSDAVVSFLKIFENPTEILSCNEMLFGISAVTGNETQLPSFTATGGYLPRAMNITPDVDITILFKSDRSPLAIVDIQLPSTICSYQHLNYSIIIGTKSDGKIFDHGPFQQNGSNINQIQETIASGLKVNMEYTLMVVLAIDTQAGVSYSQQYSFNTHLLNQLQHQSLDMYKAMFGVFVGVTFTLLLTLVISCALQNCKNKKNATATVITSRIRAINTMATNPIYNTQGPIYESITPSQFNTLPMNISAASDPTNMPNTHRSLLENSGQLSVSEMNEYTESEALNIKQSRLSKSFNAQRTNFSALHIDIVTDTGELTDNNESSGVKERPESETVLFLNQTDPNEIQTKDDGDNVYTVMNPAGTITASLKCGGHGSNMDHSVQA